MFKLSARLGALAGIISLAVASIASAQQVLFNQTYDPSPQGYYSYSYTYAGGPDSIDYAGQYTSSYYQVVGNGKNGSNGLTLHADFSQLAAQSAHVVWYWGFGGGTGVQQTLPTINPADYSVSVDLATAGNTSVPAVQIQVQLQSGGSTVVEYDYDTHPGSSFINYTFTLDQATAKFTNPGDRFDTVAPSITQINMNFNVDGTSFGEDADNFVYVDNAKMVDTAVALPEPTSVLLLGVGLAGCLLRPRRR